MRIASGEKRRIAAAPDTPATDAAEEPRAAGDATPRPPPCPELASLSKAELRNVFESAKALALAITKSNGRADEVVQTAFERLLTTRRWDPSGGPLVKHVLGIVKSLINIDYRSKAAAREARAAEGFHQEVVGYSAASPEDDRVARTEDEDRTLRAEGQLEELKARVAHVPLASAVLSLRAEGVDKAAEIARRLNAPVGQVYRAQEQLRYHLQRIRSAETDDATDEKT